MKTHFLSIIVFSILVLGIFTALQKNLSNQHTSLETAIDLPQTPEIQEQRALNHLACIMDGNRRWAKQRGLQAWEGHKEGIEAAKKVIEFCVEKKIKYLSLYTLSPENFLKRSQQELAYLFDLMMKEAQKGVEEFIKNGIRVRFIGDRALFPEHLVPFLDQIERDTAHLTTLQVNVLFCYGAQQEIAAATQAIACKVKKGELHAGAITPELVHEHLWTHDIPDPDLIIRTGKVSRLSNFLLFQAAYAELAMLDCFWPEITKKHLEAAYCKFLNSHRSFGA